MKARRHLLLCRRAAQQVAALRAGGFRFHKIDFIYGGAMAGRRREDVTPIEAYRRALELVRDRATREPDKERTQATVRRAWERGLLLLSAGTHGNVIRTLMPLVITDEQLEEGFDVLEQALEISGA